jgi:hypothetical protein
MTKITVTNLKHHATVVLESLFEITVITEYHLCQPERHEVFCLIWSDKIWSNLLEPKCKVKGTRYKNGLTHLECQCSSCDKGNVNKSYAT